MSGKQQTMGGAAHILHRPSMYLGNTPKDETEKTWVWDETVQRFILCDVVVNKGLNKTLDEILVNAGDHLGSKKQRTVSISLDPDTGRVTVHNSGGMHVHWMESGMFSVQAALGVLRTSSNFDDSEKRTRGGLNGFGAKLTNVFSTEFSVTTKDETTGLIYRQVWRDGMEHVSAPMFATKNKKFVKAQFPGVEHADFFKPPARFSGTEISFVLNFQALRTTKEAALPGMRAYLHSRAVELACSRKTTRTTLNGEDIVCRNVREWVKLFVPGVLTKDIACIEGTIGAQDEPRWSCAIVPRPSKDFPKHFSTVNGIRTREGGTHISAYNRVLQEVATKLSRKDTTFTLADVQRSATLFVCATIENPEFKDQEKSKLTLAASKHGSRPDLSSSRKVTTVLRDQILAAEAAKNIQNASRQSRSRQSMAHIKNFTDANWAGSSSKTKRDQTTIIFTEGNSAKDTADDGITDTDRFGSKALKGKVQNVLQASAKAIAKNEEVNEIIQLLGIRLHNLKSTQDRRTLRYNRVMILTDQDPDGFHIRGLLYAFFRRFAPHMLTWKDFIVVFHTPLFRVVRGHQTLDFFSDSAFRRYEDTATGSYITKHFKGIGSWSSPEAKQLFRNMSQYAVAMQPATDADILALDEAFSKDAVDKRKALMRGFHGVDDPRTIQTYRQHVTYEFAEYLIYSNKRAIPSVVDGLKPVNRKVLDVVLMDKSVPTDEDPRQGYKVSQLGGAVAKDRHYHHGDKSMTDTIINMASEQTNNLPLLYPNGNFGGWDAGIKSAAAGRYIFTKLFTYTRPLFPLGRHVKETTHSAVPVLTYLEEDGDTIEPEYFCPTVCTVLINGANGVGTGYSTVVPMHGVRDVVQRTRELLMGREPAPLVPSYPGFEGTPVRDKHQWIFRGTCTQTDAHTVEISALAPQRWTDVVIEKCRAHEWEVEKYYGDNGRPRLIVKRQHSPPPNELSSSSSSSSSSPSSSSSSSSSSRSATSSSRPPKRRKIATTLSLLEKVQSINTMTVSTNNMHLFTPDGHIKKYDTTLEILRDHFQVGTRLYQQNILAKRQCLGDELARLIRRRDYIRLSLNLSHTHAGPLRFAELDAQWRQTRPEDNPRDLFTTVTDAAKSVEKVQSLEQEIEQVQAHMAVWAQKTWRDMWLEHLNAFEESLH